MKHAHDHVVLRMHVRQSVQAGGTEVTELLAHCNDYRDAIMHL